MNNKILGIILAALVLLFLGNRFFSANKNRSFDPNVLSLDTDEINRIEISIPGESTSTLTKLGDSWRVSNGTDEYLADEYAVNSVLGELKSIEADKVVGRSDEKAEEFEVSPDKGARIVAKKDKKTLADIYIGRFSFNQQTRQPISYIQLAKKDETYLVNKFLAMSLKKDFNSLRDKSFVGVEKDDIRNLRLVKEGVENQISKVADAWHTNEGIVLDSLKISNYLNRLASLKGSTFSESTSAAVDSHTLEIGLGSGENISIKASIVEENKFRMESSSQPQNVFESNEHGIFKQVFWDLVEMLEPEEESDR
jgi:hypothetical protein